MKILLYILMVIQVISTVVIFFTTFTESFLISVIALFSGILEITLTLAVTICLNEIDNLKADCSFLQKKLHNIEEQNNPTKVAYQTPANNYGEESKKPWKCVKCDTVNKAGTKYCENCNCEFSSWVNPTYDSNPAKMSRFLKDKKKK